MKTRPLRRVTTGEWVLSALSAHSLPRIPKKHFEGAATSFLGALFFIYACAPGLATIREMNPLSAPLSRHCAHIANFLSEPGRDAV